MEIRTLILGGVGRKEAGKKRLIFRLLLAHHDIDHHTYEQRALDIVPKTGISYYFLE